MATNGYCTVADFKDWRGGPADAIDDVRIDTAIGAASRGIDRFCHTQFWKTAAGTVRVFDSCDGRWLRIGDTVAVTQVATDDDANGTFETVWTATDFQLWPLNIATPEPEPYTQIKAVGTLTFPRPTATGRLGLTQVTGMWGWPTPIPDPVFEATLLVVNRLVKRPGSPEGVAGFDEFGVVRISSRDDPDAVRLITPYKTSRRQGGWAIA